MVAPAKKKVSYERMWKEFESVIGANESGTYDHQIVQDSFYAGGLSILKMLGDAVNSATPHESAEALFEGLKEEMDAYRQGAVERAMQHMQELVKESGINPSGKPMPEGVMRAMMNSIVAKIKKDLQG